MKLSLERLRIDTVPRSAILEELRLVAKHYSGRRFSRRDFDKVSTRCKGTTVLKQFGTWDTALKALGMQLQSHKPDRTQISSRDLLAELGRIWANLGHRPSKAEWEASDAKYSYTTYKQRFGGWVNACATYVQQSTDIDTVDQDPKEKIPIPSMERPSAIPQERNRTVPLKLRLKVLSRDNFRCKLCGRTPAIHPGVVLHIDHVVPFSRGGETTIANLQTLCDMCNLGKGNGMA